VLVNTGGDALTESPASSGRFTATLAESRSGLGTLSAAVCDGTESATNLVWDGWLNEDDSIVNDTYPQTITGGGGGLTGDQQDQIDAIEAHTSLITSSTRINIAADAGSDITLKIGDDYSGSIDTAKRIEVNDADSSIYTLLIAQTTIAFGAGVGPKRDLVTGTVDPLTITHTAAVGDVPAYTTIFVECTVSDSLSALIGEYDIQITHSNGKKQTVFSGACTLTNDFKS
jgi:hypothetical protein